MKGAASNIGAGWWTTPGPEPDTVLGTHGTRYRNLGEFPFPNRCSEEERADVERRIVDALDTIGFAAKGRYRPITDIALRERRFLAERLLIDAEFPKEHNAQGVYIAQDQGMSIMVNGPEHIALRVLAPGLQLNEVWAKLNAVDDKLGDILGYAFSEDLGYLTGHLANVGTGLRITVLVHVPALFESNRVGATKEQLCGRRYAFQDLYEGYDGIESEFAAISNQSSLGQSEEEIVFHLKHVVSQITAREKAARQRLADESRRVLEDRVYRAFGVARQARLLDFPEAIRIISCLRLGIAAGLIDEYSYQQLSALHMDSHRAHIEMEQDEDCDDLTVNSRRADLFRDRLG